MKKKLLALSAGLMALMVSSVSVFASSGVDISSALSTGISDIQTQAFSAIGSVAPVAVAIAGAVIGVKIAIRALRSVVG